MAPVLLAHGILDLVAYSQELWVPLAAVHSGSEDIVLRSPFLLFLASSARLVA